MSGEDQHKKEGVGDPTVIANAGESASVGEQVGQRLGPYKLLSVIGEGGFGTVWLAERREPYVQRVAIKIIKPGMDSKAVIARFEQERQALAVMDHPNVAKVLDGGVTPLGRPYFVMEHVKGEPITEFCDKHRQTIRQRLEMFIPVCEAVQHAHMKGIIHRDIKPSNILVSFVEMGGELGGAGVGESPGTFVKVIDFGVAKAISHTLTDKTIFTEHGQIIGTPEYMSPEQAEMGAVDIDTRTDVYSLGVVLYELLTGALPFDAVMLRSKGYNAIQQIIREVEAPRPSTKLTGMDDRTGADLAARRHVERSDLARELRRELEWVPLKALRKDRRERYGSAADLAEDVRNYLAGEPLDAGPETLAYRSRKFLRRHIAGVAVAGVFLVLVVGALAGLMVQAGALREQRDLAVKEAGERRKQETLAGERARRAEAASAAALSMLDLVAQARGSPSAGRSDLEGRLVWNPSFLADFPELRATFLERVGTNMLVVGGDNAGQSMLSESLKLRTASAGENDPVTLVTMGRLGRAMTADGQGAAGRALCSDALARARVVLGAAAPQSIEIQNNLAMAAWAVGDTSDAAELLRDATAKLRGPGHTASHRLGLVLMNLGEVLWERHEMEAAAAAFEEADRVAAEVGEPDEHTPADLDGFSCAVHSRWGHPDAIGRDALYEMGIGGDSALRPVAFRYAEAAVTSYRALVTTPALDEFGRPTADGQGSPVMVNRTDEIKDTIGEAWDAYSAQVAEGSGAGFAAYLSGRGSQGTKAEREAGAYLRQISVVLSNLDELGMPLLATSIPKRKLTSEVRPPAMAPEQFQEAVQGVDDPSLLSDEAQALVLAPGATEEQARRAVELARRACAARPWSGQCAMTYGIALYRAGRTKEALSQLKQADRINSRRTDGGLPTNVAFLLLAALAEHELQLAMEAKARLTKMVPAGWLHEERKSLFDEGGIRAAEIEELRPIVAEVDKAVVSVIEAAELERRAAFEAAALERRAAMARVEQALALNEAAWKVVRDPSITPDGAAHALADARKARSLAPDDPNVTNTLGVALYRAGHFDEALGELTKAEEQYARQLKQFSRAGPLPADWAFIAMSHFKLGHVEDARSALARCRGLMEEAGHRSDQESEALLREAVGLIEGKGDAGK